LPDSFDILRDLMPLMPLPLAAAACLLPAAYFLLPCRVCTLRAA